MNRCLLLLVGLFWFFSAVSQKRNNTWYFGQYAGLDFNTSPPSALNNSLMTQEEGTACISDTNGQLLFYSEGVSVWNRNHGIMQNGTGLLGGQSSTQSALIVPKPFDNKTYYIFTVPQQSNSVPLSYSVVDMTLDGGLGGITLKNIPLHLPVLEKLSGVVSSNGTDYWVIVKEMATNAFYSYAITSAGVNPHPVISHGGFVPTSTAEVGWSRLSPDGSKFCIAYSLSNFVQLFDFNTSTGVLSNPIDLGTAANPTPAPYGIEFSPDNSKLYVMQTANAVLKQYNLLAGSPTAIQNSVVEITNLGQNSFGGAIIRGPDDKLYLAYDAVNAAAFTYVSVINEPNATGLACNFVLQAIPLLPGTITTGGLPNTINFPVVASCTPASNVSSHIQICTNQTYQLPSGTLVSTAGIYMDTIRNMTNTCDSVIYTINLSIMPVSFRDNEVQICSNQSYHLSSEIFVSEAGVYSDTVRNVAACDSIINIIHLFVNDLTFSNHADSIYPGESYTLPSGIVVHANGTYNSVLRNSAGCDSIITTTLTVRKTNTACITLKNAITPNGDGINDYWILYRDHCFKKLAVSVYNRYGSLVYHSDDYKNDWDGKYKYKSLPDGTYFYVLKAIFPNGSEQVFKDNVTLVR